MIERDIDFFISGIEDGMVAALDAVAGEYAGDIAPYGGEFENPKELQDALAALSPRFPLFLVGYGVGDDFEETATSPEPGSPVWVRHECNFVVMAASDDARGEHEQRQGVYKMLADARKALSHRQIAKVIEGETEEETETIILNPGEFIPQRNEFIAHFENVTAYAVPFKTYFRYLTPDRRALATEINQIVFTIDPLNNPRGKGGLPGVTMN